MVETLEDIDPDEISDGEGPWDYDSYRVLEVANLGQDEDTYVHITPKGGGYKTKVRWTTDSGVKKTLLSMKHFGLMLYKNPEMKLRPTRVRFQPYSTKKTVPLLGCSTVKLRNERGKAIKTVHYGLARGH